MSSAVLVAAACAHTAPQAARVPGPVGRWVAMTAPPVQPRNNPGTLVSTGTSAVYLGGSEERGDRVIQRTDGAMYDPIKRVWTPIRPAPFSPFGAVWLGDRVFIAGTDCPAVETFDEEHEITCRVSAIRAATYDPRRDQWTTLPSPDLPYEVGRIGYYGEVMAIGPNAVLRLARRIAPTNRNVHSYEAWSAADGWRALPEPPGADDNACPARDHIISLTDSPVGLSALGTALQWGKPAEAGSALREAELMCAGSRALVWKSYQRTRTWSLDIAHRRFTILPARAGLETAGQTVDISNDRTVAWELDDNDLVVLYDAASNSWHNLPRSALGREAAAVDADTVIAHGVDGKWRTITLPG